MTSAARLACSTLLLGLSATAAHAIPEKMLQAAATVKNLNGYNVHMEVDRHLPLTHNLARELYRLEAKPTAGGRYQLSLKGLDGTNKNRIFSCETPCTSAKSIWPGRPAVLIPKNDPRLYLAGAITPEGELALIANLLESRPDNIEPLLKSNGTRYTWRLLESPDAVKFASQLWSAPFNTKKERMRARLSISNITGLPREIEIVKSIKGETGTEQVVYRKKWSFNRR